MDIEALSELCKSFKAVTTDIKWEDHLCFNIGSKMFFIVSLENIPTTASFKTIDNDFEELIELEGFKPAPYLARYKWVFVDDVTRLTEDQWKLYIEKSYRAIAAKLPKKLQRELNLIS